MRLPLVAAGTTARFVSARQWRLQGSKVTAKFCTVPASGGSASGSVTMYVQAVAANTWLRWTYNAIDGKLRAYNDAGSTDATPTVLTYDPIQHAWLRIRESGGTVYFETSSDGWEWSVRRSLATPAWVAADTVQVEFAANRSGGTTDFAEFDLVGAEVRPRFYGLVNEFPVGFEGLSSTVMITATDLFKRLNRRPALRSTARRPRPGTSAATAPRAWPSPRPGPAAPSPWAARTGRPRPASRYRCSRRPRRPRASG
jgi:hypothetical protein